MSRFEMVQCDDLGPGCEGCDRHIDDALEDGWVLTDALDLCPVCADARAVEAEHNLTLGRKETEQQQAWREDTDGRYSGAGEDAGGITTDPRFWPF